MKRLIQLAAALITALVITLGWNLWQNNRNVEPPQRAELQARLDDVANWLQQRNSELVRSPNVILIWMIKEAWENTGNEKLGELYKAYKENNLDKRPTYLWTLFFKDSYRPPIPPLDRLAVLKPYQLLFVYGLSCESFLLDEPLVEQQMAPGFCANHFLHPRCVTHQVMGIRFMQRNECGFEKEIASTLPMLQATMATELTWDFRVTDAYIQRVTMLLDSGAGESVKPIWIRRVLEAQNDDGSWDNLHPLFALPNGKVVGLSSALPKIQRVSGDFHATAQAVWLISMLLRDESRD